MVTTYVFTPVKFGFKATVDFKPNTPKPLLSWPSPQQVVTGVARDIDGLRIVSAYGEVTVIPWCWITQLRKERY